jgi:hypothetical protein
MNNPNNGAHEKDFFSLLINRNSSKENENKFQRSPKNFQKDLDST